MLCRDLWLEGAQKLGTPGAKATAEQLSNEEPLECSKITPFRAVSARANYLGPDRPECQFASKEVCRWMSSAACLGLAALKRIGRSLEGRRRFVFQYHWQNAKRIDVYSNTDWSGCPKARKSTSGGCIILGTHLIKLRGGTQGLVPLFSGEVEYYGCVKAGGIGLGDPSLLKDLGIGVPLTVWTDSTASIGIRGRSGLGELRHIDTQCLWLQDKVRSVALQLRKVRGTENPADLFTKHLTNATFAEALLKLFNCVYREGDLATHRS